MVRVEVGIKVGVKIEVRVRDISTRRPPLDVGN